jgi:hypothetical protein
MSTHNDTRTNLANVAPLSCPTPTAAALIDHVLIRSLWIRASLLAGTPAHQLASQNVFVSSVAADLELPEFNNFYAVVPGANPDSLAAAFGQSGWRG